MYFADYSSSLPVLRVSRGCVGEEKMCSKGLLASVNDTLELTLIQKKKETKSCYPSNPHFPA